MSEENPNDQPRNVSAEQFNALSGKMDSFMNSFSDKFDTFLKSQTPPTPNPDPAPEPPTPKEPTELGGFNLEQIKALAAEHEARVKSDRENAVTSAAKEAGIELNDGLTKMILGSSKTNEDIKANVESLAGIKTPAQPKHDPGFNPKGDQTPGGIFGKVLTETLGENKNE